MNKIADLAVRIHAVHGCVMGKAVEWFCRDSRHAVIDRGTSEGSCAFIIAFLVMNPFRIAGIEEKYVPIGSTQPHEAKSFRSIPDNCKADRWTRETGSQFRRAAVPGRVTELPG